MLDLQATAATLLDVTLSYRELLQFMHRSGRLMPMIVEALSEKIVVHSARTAGISVHDIDLQQAANGFRRQHGLQTADRTHDWLRKNHLGVPVFEMILENAIFVEKFRKHLTVQRLEDYFSSRSSRFSCIRFSHIKVSSEGLARELLARIREEGADFAELARQHSGPCAAGVNIVALRSEFPAALGDLLFGTQGGAVVGPIADEHGWWLYLIHEVLPPRLDQRTLERIQQEIFQDWLVDQLSNVKLDFGPLVD